MSHVSIDQNGLYAPARVPIALALPQEAITLAPRAGPSSDLTGADQLPLGGAGYGPPQQSQLSPVQHLIADTLHPAADGKQREHDMVCLPITNESWQKRWEEMCVVPATTTTTTTTTTTDQTHPRSYRHSLRMSSKLSPTRTTQTAHQLEAERWRADGAFRRGEVNLVRSDETRYVIGQAAEWLEVDSPVEGIRFDSELALKQEVAYASHLHVSTIILPPPRHPVYVSDYARAVSAALATSQYATLAVRLPISGDPASSFSWTAAWDAWNTIRSLNGYHPRLVLALEMINPLPPQKILDRWKAEPIRLLIVPAQIFIPNASGYPVLGKSSQSFLKSVYKLRPTIVLTQATRGLHSAGGADAYTQYLRFLERRQDQPTPVEQYAGAYMDYLQAPLQPLMDNLETETYEGFERDPIKYAQYEEAVYEALLDRPGDRPAEIFVVGAGRGPLVTAVLKAAQRSGRSVHVTAVEKNPNAFVILEERRALEWGQSVDLFFSDMRSFRPAQRADLIVSELLGSFGDNELSPECLDGVLRWLKPEGASIPASYTAHLAPLSSAKLHAEVAGPNAGDPVKMSEQPYVVMFQQAQIMSDNGGRSNCQRIQPCWDFHHPRPDVVTDEAGLPITNGHNARTAHLTFHIPEAGVLHGFAGFFEAVLYKDIGLSIHPERMDVRQLSWFPLFFPLRDPLYVPGGTELDVHLSRLTDQVKRRIWFEWSADAYLWLPLGALMPPATNGTSEGATPKDSRTPRSGWSDAFTNALSPRLGASKSADPPNANTLARIRIGQTRLHNPGGRSSWVGL